MAVTGRSWPLDGRIIGRPPCRCDQRSHRGGRPAAFRRKFRQTLAQLADLGNERAVLRVVRVHVLLSLEDLGKRQSLQRGLVQILRQ